MSRIDPEVGYLIDVNALKPNAFLNRSKDNTEKVPFKFTAHRSRH